MKINVNTFKHNEDNNVDLINHLSNVTNILSDLDHFVYTHTFQKNTSKCVLTFDVQSDNDELTFSNFKLNDKDVKNTTKCILDMIFNDANLLKQYTNLSILDNGITTVALSLKDNPITSLQQLLLNPNYFNIIE